MENKILVFIPAYRCSNQIVRVLDKIDDELQNIIDTVLVIDNRSPDDTLEAAIKTSQQKITLCNFIAWRNNDNYGLGGSHKAAFAYAIENNFDYLIVLHGDDQADIQDIKSILKNKEYQKYDCVLGARFMTNSRLQGYSKLRTFGNRVYNVLFSLAVRNKVYDLGSGLNIYKLENFRQFYYKKYPDNLSFNYVMLLGSYYNRQNIKFFPISWREEDQISNVKLFSQAFEVVSYLCRFMMNKKKFLSTEMRSKQFTDYTGSIEYINKVMKSG